MQSLLGMLPRTCAATASTAALRSPGRRKRALGVLAGVTAFAAAAMVPAPAAVARPALVRVVVSGSDVAAATSAVNRAGGRVTETLPLINGVIAELPDGVQLPPTFVVTPDRAVTFASEDLSPPATASTVRATLGLPPSGNEGAGVTVAVVDTGVADVPDLAGRIVGHVDVTGTGGGDGYGHGTFMAGLIAGSGAGSDGAYRGVAPAASILDVKVARPDGGTDLSAVLKGLQAVVDAEHRYGVEVVNLSLSSGSPVNYQVDPLNQALRALWRKGITVIVPSGNNGPDPGSVEAPGNDPTLLTAGGLDEHGTAARDDDSVGSYSGRGPTRQGVLKPDLTAPGTSVISLRSPGSIADTSYPQARIGEQYFRGSGSSMSTAVVSGVVAGVLAKNPRLRPDDVKTLLRGTTYQAAALSDPTAAGTGGLDAAAALANATKRDIRAIAKDDVAPGDAKDWKALAAAFDKGDAGKAQKAWDALTPEARSWAARSWASLDESTKEWVARSWAARSWASADVSAEEWAARSWAARSWAGEDWAARSWAARSWASDGWAARSWAGDDWQARSWATEEWAARSWSADWR